MYKPHTIEQYKIQQFLDHTFAMEHFLVSPLSRSALMLEDRCGERIAFSFSDNEVREIPIPSAPSPRPAGGPRSARPAQENGGSGCRRKRRCAPAPPPCRRAGHGRCAGQELRRSWFLRRVFGTADSIPAAGTPRRWGTGAVRRASAFLQQNTAGVSGAQWLPMPPGKENWRNRRRIPSSSWLTLG